MDNLIPKDEAKFKRYIDTVLSIVKSKVDYADILIENVSKVEAKLLTDGQELIIPYSSKAAMQLRLVMNDGRHIEASLGLQDKNEVKGNINTLLSMLQHEKPNYDYKLASIPNPDKIRYGKQINRDLREYDVSRILTAIFNDVKQLCKDTVNVKIKPELWLFTQIEEKFIADTDNVYKTQVLPTTFIQLHVKAVKNSKVAQFRCRVADIEELGLVADENGLKNKVKEKFKEAILNAAKLLNGRKLTNEEIEKITHYVLKPSTMVFVHEAHGHNFEADLIKEGYSGLFKRNGQPVIEKICSPIIDIYDGQPLINNNFDYDQGFGTQYIDDEGVEVKPVQLVKQGKIVGKLHNRETAAYYNEKPNGHGFSELGDQRVVRMTNTYIAPAKGLITKSFEELIRDIKFGVLLEGSLGGQVSKDGMATSLQIGYLIIDGKVSDQVLLPANFAVKTREALLAAEDLAGCIEIEGAGFCGKAGQVKFVTDGGPIVKLRKTESVNLSY